MPVNGCRRSKYVRPIIGNLPVADIDTALVMRLPEPIWHETTEKSVLDWATVCELRSGENPARPRGHLEHKLWKKSKTAVVEHHPALPYQEIAAFMSELRQQDNAEARALELAMLCVSRSAEVLNPLSSAISPIGCGRFRPRG